MVALLAGVAALGLTLALARGDLTVRYVAEQTTLNLPPPYRIAALWSGDAGRRLVFALLVACGAIPVARGQSGVGRASRWTTTVLALIVLGALVWAALGSPLARLPWQPLEGRGMLPHLRTPLAAAVAPVRLLAHAILVVTLPLALDSGRLARITPWLLATWVCGGSAIALGLAVAERDAARDSLLSAAGPTTLALWWGATLVLLLPPARGWWWPAHKHVKRAIISVAFLGLSLITTSFIGRGNAVIHSATLGQGETLRMADAFDYQWSFAQQGISSFRSGDAEVTAVTLEAARVEGRTGTLLVPEWRQFLDSRGEEVFAPLSVTALARGATEDIAVALLRMMPNEEAALRIEFRPLASWLWIGCVLLLAGGAGAWLGAVRRHA